MNPTKLSDEWPLGPVFCNFYISMDVMLCTASILTLLAISVDRYLAVTMPLRYASLVLPWRVAVAMASVWVVSVAVSFLPIQMGWNTVNGTVQNQGPWSVERKCRFELNRPYVVTDSLLTFYLPLVAMCWTYLQILRIARAQAKRTVNTRPTCITSYNCRNNPSTSTTVVSSVTAMALREHKATVTLAAVIGAFVVCWLPYFILFTVLGLMEHPDPSTVPGYSIVLWLGYANSALNPILYAALNRDFRSAYTHLLRCRCTSYSGWRSREPSPNVTAARDQLTEVTLLCIHTPATCRAGLADQNIQLQEMNNRTATATIQFANGNTATDVNGNERYSIQCTFILFLIGTKIDQTSLNIRGFKGKVGDFILMHFLLN
ncbi:histamine receptor H2a isoform X3 [Parambassis ranga]|uniref:Histamine receptor H2a isoform X3 n=1 Tax=Parambassis ranga TaxID=210632 RepID=A0A6P7J879_9TELE|nr:histamine H2 receptor-like isoform X3 [Parambassis ranga]